MEPHPLRAYRQQARLSQKALAEMLGVSRTTVARWESGVRLIDRPLLGSISEKTKIPARELRPDIARLMDEAVQ